MAALKKELTCKNFIQTKSESILTYIQFFSGPLISPFAKKRVTGLISSVEEEGGKIHLDGRNLTVPGYEKGNFVGPTVVEAVTTMRAYQLSHFIQQPNPASTKYYI